jgi:two-component sensor histidine kinase
MTRRWIAATAFSALAISILAGVAIYFDRSTTIEARQDVLAGHSQLIVAHGEAALTDAAQIAAAVEPLIDKWDFRDPAIGSEIHERFKRLLAGSGHLSSAWVLDDTALNRVDSWGFPARPVSGTERPYFLTHKQGWDGALVEHDPVPGSITGRKRFTYSKAVRRGDGSLKALIVVGIYNDAFSELYRQSTRGHGASAGFFDRKGQPLTMVSTNDAALTRLAGEIAGKSADAAEGGGVVRVEGGRVVAAWARSTAYPGLFAVTKQPLDDVLANWRGRMAATIGVALALIAALAGFAVVNVRMERTRRQVQLGELAMREVHHRVKNGLQLMVSMIQMRARAQESPALKEQLREITAQVQAVAQVNDLLQNASKADSVDFNRLLEALCQSLRPNWHGNILCELGDNVVLNPDIGSTLAVIVNELMTNAMKYAREKVTVKSEIRLQHLLVTVSNDGARLPLDFKLNFTTRFGLRAAVALCSQIGGSLHAIEGVMDGAAFRLTLPVGRPEAAPAQAA